jgi:hypothetical protein
MGTMLAGATAFALDRLVTMRRLATAGLSVLAITISVTACDSVDPTAQFFPIGFQNDLGYSVVIKTCGDLHCHQFLETWKIAKGKRGSDMISDCGVETS